MSLKITAEMRQRIVAAYQGREPIDGRPPQRMFLWEEGDRVMLGNTYAYAKFIGISWGAIHSVLRDEGYRILEYTPRQGHTDPVGETPEPEPYAEQVGTVDVPVTRNRGEVIQAIAQLQVRMNELINELLAMEESGS